MALVVNPSGRVVSVPEDNYGYQYAKLGLHGWSLAPDTTGEGGASAPPVAEPEPEDFDTAALPPKRRGRPRKYPRPE